MGLTRGLQNWWLAGATPKGIVWHDLANRCDMDLISDPQWDGQPRHGGVTPLTFDAASSQYAVCTDPAALARLTALSSGTLSFWLKGTAASDTTENPIWIGDVATTDDRFTIAMGSQTATYADEAIGIVRVKGGTIDLAAWDRAGVGAYQDGEWRHFIYTTEAGRNAWYVNGKPTTLAYQTGSASTNAFMDLSNVDEFSFGRRGLTAFGKNYFTGSIDSVKVFDLAVSDAQAFRLFVEEKQGHFRTLRIPRPLAGTSQPTCTVTTSGITDEDSITAGGGTITLTLDGDYWVAEPTFSDNVQHLIDGLDSAQSEATGWDAVVKAGLTAGDVSRNSPLEVVITLPAFASYNITAQETITTTVPASMLLNFAQDLLGDATFTVDTAVEGVYVMPVWSPDLAVPHKGAALAY